LRTRTVSSQMMPSVPSEPMYSCVNSYPEEDFRTGRRVSKSSPCAVTTSKEMTFSLVVPYRKVVMPLPPVDAIPPKQGFDEGSGPNSNPFGSKNLLSSSLYTPAPTTAIISVSRTSIRRNFSVEITTPPP